MPGRTLSLFCLVRGDTPPSERVFIVEIAETAQVATLKERIYDKNKRALSDLTDHSLTLWKVDQILDEKFDQYIAGLPSDLSTNSNAVKLKPWDELSSIFPVDKEISNSHLHIIVEQPFTSGAVKGLGKSKFWTPPGKISLPHPKDFTPPKLTPPKLTAPKINFPTPKMEMPKVDFKIRMLVNGTQKIKDDWIVVKGKDADLPPVPPTGDKAEREPDEGAGEAKTDGEASKEAVATEEKSR